MESSAHKVQHTLRSVTPLSSGFYGAVNRRILIHRLWTWIWRRDRTWEAQGPGTRIIIWLCASNAHCNR